MSFFQPIKSVPPAMFGKVQRPAYNPLIEIFNRKIPGMSPMLRRSFEEHYSEDPAEGVIGWSFERGAIGYSCLYKSSSDPSKKYDFGMAVSVPSDQPYLHAKDKMGLAEKAYVLSVVQRLIPPFQKQQLGGMLFEFEQACSREDFAVVDRAQCATNILLPEGKVMVHYGLEFPDDAQYLEYPEENVLFIEWRHGKLRYTIDCSDGLPVFQVGKYKKNGPSVFMSQAEARSAIGFVRDVMRHDAKFENISRRSNLFDSMGFSTFFLPDFRLALP